MLLYTARVLGQLALGSFKPATINRMKKIPTTDVAFRCYPIDIDTYLHMNNSQYLRVAELARWKIFPATGLLDKAVKNKYMFLAVEQSIRYSRPIQPFQRYVVATTCTVYDDNKWLWYKHTFEQHPDDVKPGQEPREYAVIDLKAVLKEQSGKTIKPSDQLDASEFSKELFVFKKGTKIFPFQEPEEVIETQTEGQGEGQELGAGIRARDEFGRFLGDDVGTKEWNEAWVDGKSPAKK